MSRRFSSGGSISVSANRVTRGVRGNSLTQNTCPNPTESSDQYPWNDEANKRPSDRNPVSVVELRRTIFWLFHVTHLPSALCLSGWAQSSVAGGHFPANIRPMCSTTRFFPSCDCELTLVSHIDRSQRVNQITQHAKNSSFDCFQVHQYYLFS